MILADSHYAESQTNPVPVWPKDSIYAEPALHWNNDIDEINITQVYSSIVFILTQTRKYTEYETRNNAIKS